MRAGGNERPVTMVPYQKGLRKRREERHIIKMDTKERKTTDSSMDGRLGRFAGVPPVHLINLYTRLYLSDVKQITAFTYINSAALRSPMYSCSVGLEVTPHSSSSSSSTVL